MKKLYVKISINNLKFLKNIRFFGYYHETYLENIKKSTKPIKQFFG